MLRQFLLLPLALPPRKSLQLPPARPAREARRGHAEDRVRARLAPAHLRQLVGQRQEHAVRRALPDFERCAVQVLRFRHIASLWTGAFFERDLLWRLLPGLDQELDLGAQLQLPPEELESKRQGGPVLLAGDGDLLILRRPPVARGAEQQQERTCRTGRDQGLEEGQVQDLFQQRVLGHREAELLEPVERGFRGLVEHHAQVVAEVVQVVLEEELGALPHGHLQLGRVQDNVGDEVERDVGLAVEAPSGLYEAGRTGGLPQVRNERIHVEEGAAQRSEPCRCTLPTLPRVEHDQFLVAGVVQE
mmetsp:Transcript_77085/g.208227  ORF Transcript_77085/g.208227 Transcript_77085/m.208227 type:complete len:303 (-) Transcript_77085:406-1314(-)